MTTHTNPKPPTRYNQSQNHIKTYYNIPVKRGLDVIFEGKPGKITGLDGQYILIRLNTQGPTDQPLRCHPTWRMAYPTLGIKATE